MFSRIRYIHAALVLGCFLALAVAWVGGTADEPTPSSVSPAFEAMLEFEPLPGQGVEASDEAEPEPDPPKDQPVAKKSKKTPPRSQAKSRELKPALLHVVTNFDKADVTVNGLAYPEYSEPGEPEGMVLPAGGPYRVEVKFEGKVKEYQIHLRPHETRLLMVELSGFGGGAPTPPKPAKVEKKEEKKEEPEKEEKKDDKGPGKITVYSKPPGTVIVDGKKTGEKTPGSVELENGRHEVQVEYETGSTSEKKIVRVRTGSRIKLFFRERKK